MSADKIELLAGLLRKHMGAVVLTGAGISTESGIPDFRSPATGLYNSIDPMEYLSVQAMRARPEKFWKYFTDVFGPVVDAEPNAGHKALAALEEACFVSTIVTQNIDGLHQKAGSRQVFEVHGHLRTAHCEGCLDITPLSGALDQVRAGSLPKCSICGAKLRPDVVLFGDMMPEVFSLSIDAARAADMMLVVGSSLTVSPANTLALEPPILAIINRDETPFDDRADVIIRGGAGEILEAVAKALT